MRELLTKSWVPPSNPVVAGGSNGSGGTEGWTQEWPLVLPGPPSEEAKS